MRGSYSDASSALNFRSKAAAVSRDVMILKCWGDVKTSGTIRQKILKEAKPGTAVYRSARDITQNTVARTPDQGPAQGLTLDEIDPLPNVQEIRGRDIKEQTKGDAHAVKRRRAKRMSARKTKRRRLCGCSLNASSRWFRFRNQKAHAQCWGNGQPDGTRAHQPKQLTDRLQCSKAQSTYCLVGR